MCPNVFVITSARALAPPSPLMLLKKCSLRREVGVELNKISWQWNRGNRLHKNREGKTSNTLKLLSLTGSQRYT